MTLTAIIQARPEIKKRIYTAYPSTKMERRGCAREKARLDWLRLAMAKRLIAEELTVTKAEYK